MTTEENTLAAIAIDPNATCIGCGYALRELTECRCPECGRRFDTDNPSSYRLPGDRRIWRRFVFAMVPIVVWTAICVAFAAIYVAHYWFRPPEHAGLVMAIILFTATSIRSRVRRSLLRGQPEPAPRSERVAKLAIYLFIAVFFVDHKGVDAWSCPHGTGYGIGGVGIALSSNGGPCHNNVEHLQAWHVRGNFYVWTSW